MVLVMIVFWHLDPMKAVGPVEFGAPIGPLVEDYGLIFVPGDGEESDVYEFPDHEVRVYVENGVVERVGCFEELFFEGQNLFGLTLDEIRALLGPEDEIGDEAPEVGTPVEFDRWSIQVWLEEEGLVNAVMCYGVIEDE